MDILRRIVINFEHSSIVRNIDVHRNGLIPSQYSTTCLAIFSLATIRTVAIFREKIAKHLFPKHDHQTYRKLLHKHPEAKYCESPHRIKAVETAPEMMNAREADGRF
jgi:hypothetical protein